MTLEEKIRSINVVDGDSKLISMETDYKIRIEDFWTDFILPRLPDRDVVKAWSKLLIDYTNEDDAVFAIRAFAGRSKKDTESKKDDELRRGFLTVPNNATYSYFFTDNSFAAYFYKMALDGFVPSLKEFKIVMKERRFPAHFGQNCNIEKKKAAYKIGATPVPTIGQYGYKISHVSDAGEHYSFNGNDDFSITDLSKMYFPRGKYSEWKYDSVMDCYVRNLDVLPQTRDVLVAHFLRFVNPFNHFLTPKAKNTVTSKKTGITTTKIYNKYFNYIKGEEKYDIGEFKPLIDYVNERYEKDIYIDDYLKYKELLLLPNDFFETASGDDTIDVEYGNPLQVFTSSKSTGSVAPTPSTTPKITVKKSSTSTVKNDNKTLVFKLLNDLVTNGKITDELLLKLSDKKFTHQTFGIPSTYSLLVKESEFALLGCDTKKYYNPQRLIINGEEYRVCSQWIPERIEKLITWHASL